MRIEVQDGRLRFTLSAEERETCEEQLPALDRAYPGERFDLTRLLFLLAFQVFLGRAPVSRHPGERPQADADLTLAAGLPLRPGGAPRRLAASVHLEAAAGPIESLSLEDGSLRVVDADTDEDLTGTLRPELRVAFLGRFRDHLLGPAVASA